MLLMGSGDVSVAVEPEMGGRITALSVCGREMILGAEQPGGGSRHHLGWGMYPMVPFAGRIRDARFTFDGRVHRLQTRMPPHAIHGTVDDVAWEVRERATDSVTMDRDLGGTWPFRGSVRHHVEVSDDSVSFRLVLTAHDRMPAQVGWHPWFRRPAIVRDEFDTWLPRGPDGMPGELTGVGLPDINSGVDDCFVSTGRPVRVKVDGVNLELSSDCSHWVVYSQDPEGICVEPQSGPPNATAHAPFVLEAGQTLDRRFTIEWISS